eukprot:m.133976 g.133976  ORF g.133976 m.133976 type:complete len:166 (-) comp15966_c0_seq1:2786-3283(-)
MALRQVARCVQLSGRLSRQHQQAAALQSRWLSTKMTSEPQEKVIEEGKVVIQPYRPERAAESDDKLRRRLLYQARKRGIKENDLIFSTFCHKYLDALNRTQLEELDIIFNEHDNEWDMFNWLTGKDPTPDYLKDLSTFVELKEHTQNRSKEVRVTMPPLHPNTSS